MNTEHNYLIHWLKKGEKARYIDKVKLPNGRWRYFYTQAEIDAYKKGLSRGASSLADKARQGLRNLKEGALNTGARAVVGAARRSEFVSDRIGGMEKLALDRYKNTANQYNAEARGKSNLAQRERAKAISAYRHGQEERVNDALDREHGLNRQARKARAEAADWQRIAAEGQEKYDKTLLGRAEKRVKTDDIRRNNEKRRAAQQANNKQTTQKSRESLGSRASKAIGNAREAVADRAAEALVSAASKSKAVRNATGGKHEDNSREWGKMADASQRRSQAADRKAHQDSATAARQDRKYGSGGDAYRRSAQANREEAESAASNASALRSKSAAERKEYEQSLLGRAQARVNRKKSRR